MAGLVKSYLDSSSGSAPRGPGDREENASFVGDADPIDGLAVLSRPCTALPSGATIAAPLWRWKQKTQGPQKGTLKNSRRP
jgi:hypothetical protein